MKNRVAPSAALEAAIDELLSEGLGDSEQLVEVGRLGARLVLQRSLEEEVADYLGRVRCERTSGARGFRNGVRPRRVQTAEGELEVQMPQLRNTADRFVSRVLPDVRTVIRTRPLEALIIGAHVRGLSDLDIESLLQQAGLGKFSKSTASRVCRELCDRYRACRARSLAEVKLLVLFLDAIYLPTRPSGAKEGVLVAWGYTEAGELVRLDVAWGCGSATRTGWRWAVAQTGGDSERPGWRWSTAPRVSARRSPSSGRRAIAGAARRTGCAT